MAFFVKWSAYTTLKTILKEKKNCRTEKKTLLKRPDSKREEKKPPQN